MHRLLSLIFITASLSAALPENIHMSQQELTGEALVNAIGNPFQRVGVGTIITDVESLYGKKKSVMTSSLHTDPHSFQAVKDIRALANRTKLIVYQLENESNKDCTIGMSDLIPKAILESKKVLKTFDTASLVIYNQLMVGVVVTWMLVATAASYSLMESLTADSEDGRDLGLFVMLLSLGVGGIMSIILGGAAQIEHIGHTNARKKIERGLRRSVSDRNGTVLQDFGTDLPAAVTIPAQGMLRFPVLVTT